MRFLCVGNIACDVILQPVGSGYVQNRILLKSADLFAGGDALNVAVDLSVLEEEVTLIGCIGKDDFGDKVMRVLGEYPIDTRYIVHSKEVATVTSVLLLEQGGERKAAYRCGGNENLTESDVPDEAISWADHVHLGSPLRFTAMDGEGTCRLFKRAKEQGKTTSMDLVEPLDDIWLPKIEDTLHYCDIFLPSDYEVSRVCGLNDPLEMKEFFRPYGLSVFGVKMGGKGVFITDYKQDIWMAPVCSETPMDTLGAGDAFVATFLSAYKRNLPLKTCVIMASFASGYVIQEFGTTSGMKGFDKLYQDALHYDAAEK